MTTEKPYKTWERWAGPLFWYPIFAIGTVAILALSFALCYAALYLLLSMIGR